MNEPHDNGPAPDRTEAVDRYFTGSALEAQLTRVELALNRAMESLMRWSIEGHKGLVRRSLSYPDLLILHSIRMRGSEVSLSELLVFLNRHDVSNLQYSLKKLEGDGLIARVESEARGKDACFRLCESGMRVTERYAAMRQKLLVPLVAETAEATERLLAAAQILERLPGLYEQSAQRHANTRIMGEDQSF